MSNVLTDSCAKEGHAVYVLEGLKTYKEESNGVHGLEELKETLVCVTRIRAIAIEECVCSNYAYEENPVCY